MIKVGIIGYGYWGPNLARNFNLIDNCLIKTIVDLKDDRLKLAKKNYPNIHISNDCNSIIDDPEINAVIIATSVSTHYELAKGCLFKNKHVLIEKPMTDSREKCLQLIDLAIKKNLLLMIDHTYLYTGAVRKIKELIDNNEIGNINYFDSVRINMGLFQHDINVIWDLAPHDISILQYLINETPESITATGISHTNNNIENIAYLNLFFNSSKMAHFSVSWSSPVKIRKILIGGDKKMIVYDDLEPTDKVRIYDTGYSINYSKEEEKNIMLVDYRIGDIFMPKLDTTEALKNVSLDFVNCILNNKEPISNWKIGLEIVTILEAAQKSIRNRGKEIKII